MKCGRILGVVIVRSDFSISVPVQASLWSVIDFTEKLSCFCYLSIDLFETRGYITVTKGIKHFF